MKAFLALCLTSQHADHIYGKLERRARRNPSREVTVQKKIKNMLFASGRREKGDPKCVCAHVCV